MIRETIRPHLRSAGFTKKRNTFARDVDCARQSVEFQASQFGSREHVKFTINVGVDYEPLDDPWQLRVRIGHLLPRGEDTWWELADTTDVGDLEARLADLLDQHALPWFEDRKTFSDLQELLTRRPDRIDIESLDRLAVLCRRAGLDELPTTALAEADHRRRRSP